MQSDKKVADLAHLYLLRSNRYSRHLVYGNNPKLEIFILSATPKHKFSLEWDHVESYAGGTD